MQGRPTQEMLWSRQVENSLLMCDDLHVGQFFLVIDLPQLKRIVNSSVHLTQQRDDVLPYLDLNN